jgi:2-iminoacetate synthase ThiH
MKRKKKTCLTSCLFCRHSRLTNTKKGTWSSPQLHEEERQAARNQSQQA